MCRKSDIRECRGKGIEHLRWQLRGLISKINLYFPGAKVWFQSLVPLPLQDEWTVLNIEAYNKMLYEVCSFSGAYYINCFDMFLAETRSGILLRYDPLFVSGTNIHPNSRGLSLIASKYLLIIHNRRFNPIGY